MLFFQYMDGSEGKILESKYLLILVWLYFSLAYFILIVLGVPSPFLCVPLFFFSSAAASFTALIFIYPVSGAGMGLLVTTLSALILIFGYSYLKRSSLKNLNKFFISLFILVSLSFFGDIVITGQWLPLAGDSCVL